MSLEQKDIEIGEEDYDAEMEFLNELEANDDLGLYMGEDIDSCAALAILDGVPVPYYYTEEEE